MRIFKLKNALGAEFDMMRRDALFHAPDGLGSSWTRGYAAAGHDYLLTDETLDQKMPSGEMVFRGYAQYREFAAFCAHKPLVLCYKPEDTWMYLDCDLASIGRTEIGHSTNRLICPVNFVAKGTWYAEYIYKKAGDDPSVGKKYPYRYPYRYSAGGAGIVAIDNKGTADSPLRIQIFGPCENPAWSLYVNGTKMADGRVNTQLQSGEVLRVCSAPREMEIAIYNAVTGTFVRDAYADSDFSTARLILAPPGRSMLSFRQGEGERVEMLVGVKQQWE